MTTYRITAPNGKTYQIEGPAGASDADVARAVMAQFPESAQAAPPAEESGFLRQVADVPVSVARGAAMGVRMVADAFGANNPVSNSIKSVEGYLSGLMSAQAKQDEQEISRIMQEAEDKGVLEQVKAGFRAFATAPVDLLSQGLGTAAPAILAALGGKVLGATALATRAIGAGVGAGMGSGAVKGQIYEGVKEALAGTDMSPEQVEARAQLAQSYGGENLDMILAGAALGGLASATGIEPILARQAAKSIVGRSIAGRATTTGVAEAVPEIAQGSQEQLAQNIALQREGFDVDTFRGVAGAGTLEGLAGAGLGATVGAATELAARRPQGKEPQPPDADIETPPDVAPDAGIEPVDTELDTPTPQPGATTPPTGRFSDADLIATGVEIPPASLPLIRSLTVGKTREELQGFIAENPEYFENDSAGARVIRSLAAEPVRQPDQIDVERPTPVAGPVAGPAVIPAPAPIPAAPETPIGITPPKAIEAETQRPQAPRVPVPPKQVDRFGELLPGPLDQDQAPPRLSDDELIELGLPTEARKPREPKEPKAPTIRPIDNPANIGGDASFTWKPGDTPPMVPVASGGTPFRSRREAEAARRFQPAMRLLKVPNGFLLTPKTDAQMDAQARMGRRLGMASTGKKGTPRSAMEFIAEKGGIDPRFKSETIYPDRNPRVGNRFLFAAPGKGLSLGQMSEALQQEGYIDIDDIGLALDAINRGTYTAEGYERLAEAERDRLEQENKLSELLDEATAEWAEELGYDASDLIDAGLLETTDKVKAEVEEMLRRAEALGIHEDDVLQKAIDDAYTKAELQGRAKPTQYEIYTTARKELQSVLERGAEDRIEDTGQPSAARDELKLTPATPETFQAEEERAKQAAAEEARAAEEAEKAKAEADKERERKEIEQRSAGAADDFKLGQSAEENLTGQKDIFAQPQELQISPEKEKEQALKLFSSKLFLTTASFKAKYANRTVLLRPKPLSEKQKAQLEELARKAIDLGLPASTLSLVTDFGATSMSGAAAMSESGSFLLSKEWASASESDKLHSFVHELAHAIDFQIAPQLTGGKKFSAEAKWSTAHDELKGWYDKNPFLNPLTYPFATRYAGTTNLKMESFAQAVALYITAPERLKNNALQAYSQVQAIVEGIQNESKATSATSAAKTSPSGVNVRQARAEKDSAVQPAAGKVGTGVSKVARGKDRAADQVTGDTIEVDGKKRPTRNADGRLIESTPEKLRNFWRFFGDSKVVDEKGEPLVVYHGTDARFNAFRMREAELGKGAYFTNDREWAEGFGSRIVDAYVSIQNPLRLTGPYGAEVDQYGNPFDPNNIPAGHDGIIHQQSEGAPLEIVAFTPTQIKSTTGNIGTYGDVQEINLMESPVQDPDALKGEGKKAVENSRESILYQPIDGTWNTPMDPKPLKLSDEFFYNWVDKQVDLKRVVDAIGATGKRIAGKFNALERERTYHGRVADRTNKYLTEELQPTLDLMQKYGITQREIGEYLLNRHAPEANKVIADRNPRFPDAGSSVTTAEAINYMNSLDPLRKRQLDAVAKRMDKTLTKMQDMLVKEGVETQDTIDGWRDMFQYYIPLVRMDADYSINKVMSQGAGYSRSGATAKSRTGSSKEVNLDEIFSNIAMQHERMIVRAEGNRIGQALFGLALTEPNPGFWLALDPDTNVIWKTIKELEDIKANRDLLKEMIESGELSPSQEAEYRLELDLIRRIIRKKEQPARAAFAKARDDLMKDLEFSREDATKLVEQLMMPPMKARYNKEKNEVVYEPNAAVNNEFVFATRINGSDKFVLFNGNDERANRMVRGLKSMDAENLSEAMNLAATITRFFAAINTQYNPVFGAYNFLRDVQTAALQISTTEIADKRSEVINGTPAALKAIFQVARARRDGKKVKGGLADDFAEFESEGGQTGFRNLYSQSEERAKAIQRQIDPSSWADSKLGNFFTAGGTLKVPFETMRKGAAPLFNFLSDYNQALENAVRLSAYRVAREKFKSQGMSLADAKQKAATIAKDITVNFNQKGVKATQMGALYAFFNASVQGTAMMARTLAGPLGRKIIAGGMLWGVIQTIMLAMAGFDDEEPPEFVKQRNFIIPYGDGKYLAFPMPLGFNVIPTLSRLATEAVISGGDNVSGKAVSALDAVMDMFNPIGNAGLSLQTITPTLLDPLAALFENKSWTGQSIAREDFSALNPTPGFTRSRDSANAVSQELARLLNSISGGNEARKGLISPTADQIEYLTGQLTGGVGRETIKGIKSVEALVTGEELPSYSVPLVGRFHGNVNEMAAVSSAFYRNLTELNIQKNEIKAIRENKGDVQAYLAENPEARLAQMATAQYNQIKNLRKLRQAALEKGDKERAKKLEEAIKTRMVNLNERYRKAVE